MNEKYIEYTVELKKTYHVSVPAYIEDWDTVYDHCIDAVYKMKCLDPDDIEIVDTKAWIDYDEDYDREGYNNGDMGQEGSSID